MRTRLLLSVCLLFLCSPLVAAYHTAQQSVQGRDPSRGEERTGKARLSGRVFDAHTGRPLRRAVVRVSSSELRGGKSVSTDSEGQWVIRELPAGRFSIQVTKAGYVPLSYGQRRPFEAGKPVEVAEGKHVERLDVALPRGGAITGRVVDEFGEPVGNAAVSAMRYAFAGGQRRLLPNGVMDRTDDLGQFRVHGLSPGDYYVSVRANSDAFLETSEGAVGYAETFYPGTLNPAEATRLHLAVGQEAQNILINMNPTRVATLSGSVFTSEGTLLTSGMVWLNSRSNTTASGTQMRTVRNGAWTFSGVVPGDYLLAAQYVPALTQIARTGTTENMSVAEISVMPVTVSGDDMTGITLTTAVGGTVSGRARLEGGTLSATNASVRAVGSAPDSAALGATARFKSDWSFSLTGLAGRILVRPSGLPAEWMLKSVMHNGNDVTDTGFEIGIGQQLPDVELLLTRNGAQVSGSVQTAKGAPVLDYAVVVFPEDEKHWGWQSRFVKAARPDQTGGFSIAGLPVGSYLCVALEYLEPGQETDPEFLRSIAPLATAIKLAESEKKALTLRLTER